MTFVSIRRQEKLILELTFRWKKNLVFDHISVQKPEATKAFRIAKRSVGFRISWIDHTHLQYSKNWSGVIPIFAVVVSAPRLSTLPDRIMVTFALYHLGQVAWVWLLLSRLAFVISLVSLRMAGFMYPLPLSQHQDFIGVFTELRAKLFSEWLRQSVSFDNLNSPKPFCKPRLSKY